MAVSEKKVTMTFDWPLVGAVLFISLLGMVNLISAVPSPNFWHRQLLSLLFSILVMVLVAGVHYRFFERIAYPAYGFFLVLLLITVLWGTWVGGSKSWLRLGPLSMQPSEFVKLGTIIALAKYFHDRRISGPYGLRGFLTPALIGLCPAV